MRNSTPQNPVDQYGFTLIELMISLVLGLLISAAIMQVFLTSQRVDRIQTAGSEIQDKAVFGLQSIEPQIRLANLGNNGVAINDLTNKGGIVLTAGEKGATDVNAAVAGGGQQAADDFLTHTLGNDDLSNIDGIPSDQLTIQYINTTGRKLYDCEGKDIELDAHVITRYFIKESSNSTDETRENLNLNCDAGRITSDGELEDFRDSGETIIQNIDQFNIRLGVQQSVVTGGTVSYQYADMTIEGYMELTGDKPSITNIRIAILAKSNANSPDATDGPFKIFGEDQNLKDEDDAPKYLRRVYESNILLRNARVMRIIDTSVT